MRRTIVMVTSVVLCLSLAVPASSGEGSQFRPPVRSDGGVVAAESMPAARAGVAVLDRGGNAIDAAVASVFALGVSRPQSCGIGGGGFLVYRSASGETATLDFRETAPAAVTPQVFQGAGIYGEFTGHKTVGVPGIVAGMWKALARYGTIDWADAIAPAARLAREGTTVPQTMSTSMAQNAQRLRKFPAAANVYLIGGVSPYPAGSTLVQPDYADSLSLIAKRGPAAFYRGRIARLIVEDMRDSQSSPYPGDEGLMTRADLASYRAKWRTPLMGTYRGRQIVAMPPPTSGGIAILEMLNLLEGYPMRSFGHSSADHFHFMAESQKIAFADRGEYVADPDFVNVPTQRLIGKSYADRRRDEIKRFRAQESYPPGSFGRGGERERGSRNRQGSTSHLSVIDRWGNAVAVTCTIEQEFGSAVVAPGTGFLLNNELTDFEDPGTANQAEGGKRPRSSMSPTIVAQDGRPVLVTGGAGGIRIIMGVLHAIVNRIDYRMDVAHAIDAERIDALQGLPLEIEDARVSPAAQTELQRRGHQLLRRGEYSLRPKVQGAATNLGTGRRAASSDSRSDFGSAGQ